MAFVGHPNPEYQADGFTRAEVSSLVSGNTSAAASNSTNLSYTTSRVGSLSLVLSLTTSTANSG